MRHVKFSNLLAIVLIGVTACSGVRSPEQQPAEPDAFFREFFNDGEPGGAVLLMKGDSVVFSRGYGLADMVTREPITTETLFNLGSVSKTFVANAILMLEEQGKLSLDDDLYQYFPGFKNPEIAKKVKIKHLLSHTSGLPDNRQVGRDTVYFLTAKDAENWYPVTQADALRFEPGSQFEYSNPAYNGLALIVEKVSGMRWQQFVIDRIMRPSGMMTSTITDGPHPASGVAHAYNRNHNGEWIEDDYGEEPTFAAAGNSGVWSSVEELARYELALQNGTFLPRARVNESRTVQRFENWNGKTRSVSGWSWHEPNVGWSWFINTDSAGHHIVGHTGTQGGFVANYVSMPKEGLLLVVLCNSPRDIKRMSDGALAWMQQSVSRKKD